MSKFLYFIQGVDGGCIKIGISDDVVRRLKEIQRTSPVMLTILAVCEGGRGLEEYLHTQFGDVRSHYEWFNVTDELMSLVAQVQAGESIVIEYKSIEVDAIPTTDEGIDGTCKLDGCYEVVTRSNQLFCCKSHSNRHNYEERTQS